MRITDTGTAVAEWFRLNGLDLAVAALAAAVIFLALRSLRGLGRRLCRRDVGGTGWPKIIGRVIAKTGTLFMIALAARLVINYAAAPPAVGEAVAFLFTVTAVIQGAVWARAFILAFVENRTATGDSDALGSAMNIIRLLVSVTVFILAAIVILDNLGVNVTGLVAGLGIGGIAIGLAAQGIFADLFAALSILFDRPFRRGDAIAYDQTNGTVEAIGLKSTRLRSLTGEERVISNKNLLDKEIRNNSRLDHRRGKFALALAQQLGADKAATLPGRLEALVRAEGLEFVRAGFVAFGATTLDFEVEYDVPGSDYEAFYAARHRLGVAILNSLAEAEVMLAAPLAPPSPWRGEGDSGRQA